MKIKHFIGILCIIKIDIGGLLLNGILVAVGGATARIEQTERVIVFSDGFSISLDKNIMDFKHGNLEVFSRSRGVP